MNDTRAELWDIRSGNRIGVHPTMDKAIQQIILDLEGDTDGVSLGWWDDHDSVTVYTGNELKTIVLSYMEQTIGK